MQGGTAWQLTHLETQTRRYPTPLRQEYLQSPSLRIMSFLSLADHVNVLRVSRQVSLQACVGLENVLDLALRRAFWHLAVSVDGLDDHQVNAVTLNFSGVRLVVPGHTLQVPAWCLSSPRRRCDLSLCFAPPVSGCCGATVRFSGHNSHTTLSA